MLHLVLVFCLSGNPQTCQSWEPISGHELTQQECAIGAHMVASVAQEWLSTHDGYDLAGWRCVWGPLSRDL